MLQQNGNSNTWICPGCSSGNPTSLARCHLCAYKQPEVPAVSPTLKTNLAGSSTDTVERPCPSCTYMNRVSQKKCDMCSIDLINAFLNEGDDIYNGTGGALSGVSGDFVRIGFKKGGSSAFYDKLQVALKMKVWEVSYHFYFILFLSMW